MMLFYKKKSDKNEKIAQVMMQEIMKVNDQKLNDNILHCALNANFEKDMYKLMSKSLKNK
jgi:hypothetical protein